MATISFYIPGKARPQGSKSAFVIRGRAVLVESNKDLKKARAEVSALIQAEAYAEKWQRIDRPAAARVTAFMNFAPPASWSAKKRAAAIAGNIRHTTKPDTDKLLRYLLDAITDAGNVWEDDSQVDFIVVSKGYAAEPHTMLIVSDNV